MSTPLRAFLMLHDTDGTWDVEVHRDLEPLLEAWEKYNDGKRTAVIHIGFYRSPSKIFDDCVQKFPSRVLLTASAKFSLPKGYETSFNPVASIDDVPIYLATRGWGYESDELDKLAVAQPSLYFKDAWLLNFVDNYANYASQLLEFEIVDDRSYLEHEYNLENQLRHLIGEFRTIYLMGDEKEDPCLFSKFSPPWLITQRFDNLNVTIRILNVFKKKNIFCVSDLQKITLDELLKFQHLGRTSVGGLMEALRSALKRGPLIKNDEGVHAFPDDISLISAIERTLSSLPAQQADVIKRRMGLKCPPQTLAEIGDSYGVTRERIRQIEAKAMNRLLAVETWDDLLASKLYKLLNGRKFPLPLLGIEAVDHWFEGISEHAEAVRYLLNNITDGKISLIKIDNIEYFSFMSVEKWDYIQKEARELLISGIDQQWDEDFCKSIVVALIPEYATEFSSILWKKSSERCVFIDKNGKKILQMHGRSADTFVLAILDESPVPLHYNKIAYLASLRSNKQIDPRRAHIAASEIGMLFGRGTYGLAKHLKISEKELDTLGKAAEDLILDSDIERQWHCSELLELLHDLPDAVDKYHLDIALKRRGNLQSLGRMVWAEPGALSEASRLEVYKTALTVMIAAGRPLTTTELRQRVCAIRGIPQNFQVTAVDPLLKVGTSRWGLNDRDFTTKREQQLPLLDQLVSLLHERTIGIHISELKNFLVTDILFLPDEVFGFYVLDSRLAVTAGQDGYIYLREWGTPRRETATEAAKSIMKENIGKPIHVEYLAINVSNRIGRTIHYSFLYGAFKSINARLLSPSIWQYDGEDDGEDYIEELQ